MFNWSSKFSSLSDAPRDGEPLGDPSTETVAGPSLVDRLVAATKKSISEKKIFIETVTNHAKTFTIDTIIGHANTSVLSECTINFDSQACVNIQGFFKLSIKERNDVVALVALDLKSKGVDVYHAGNIITVKWLIPSDPK